MEVQQTLGGRYKLLNELGRGGMAVVWKAHDEVLNRPVAVKVLAGRYAGDELSRARIRAEARAAATLSHPNIAQVYDFGEENDDGACLSYVVMELINGPTLAERVAQGPVPPRAAFRICGEVAAALAAAHGYGLVHRDIKPANVMVTPARSKVVDFGIAAAAGPGRPDEELLGTPAYLAPERLLSDRIEPASDVYALGILIFRLLTNESPWSVESTTQMLDAHVYIEPDPMPQLAGVPADVTDLVHRCLLKDPAERPSAAEASTILLEAADVAPELFGGRAAGQREPSANVKRGGEATGDHAVKAANAAAAVAAAAPGPGTNAGPEIKTKGRNQRRRLLGAAGGLAFALVAALLLWNYLPAEADGTRGDQVALAPSTPAGPADVRTDPAAPGASNQPVVPDGGAGQAPGAAPDEVIPGVIGSPSSAAPSSSTGPTAGNSTPPFSEAPPSSTPEEPKARTLSSSGGTVLARCAGAKVTLLEWDPIDPYKVEKVNAGPGVTAGIVFKHKGSKIRMTVTCVAGVPTPVSLPL